jgi:hypothetical protein
LPDEFDGVARVVAITGRRNPAHYLWGEVAAQLKSPRPSGASFWAEGPRAPDETDWKDLLGSEPTLIMFDELPAWFDYAVAQPVGGGTLANVARYALANLFEAARKTGNTCIVASNLSGGAYPDAVRDLERKAFRGARPVEPVSLQGGDIFTILRKRLFAKLASAQQIDAVTDAYVDGGGSKSARCPKNAGAARRRNPRLLSVPPPLRRPDCHLPQRRGLSADARPVESCRKDRAGCLAAPDQ